MDGLIKKKTLSIVITGIRARKRQLQMVKYKQKDIYQLNVKNIKLNIILGRMFE